MSRGTNQKFKFTYLMRMRGIGLPAFRSKHCKPIYTV